MSKQMTLGTGFEKYSKTTRREKFLTEMDRIVPWGELCGLIAPVYPQAGNGRPPKELETMLRTYFLQQWFNLSDPGVEEALYDSVSMRRFAGIDLGEMPVPDESTVLRFRHLLEQHSLGENWSDVEARLQSRAKAGQVAGNLNTLIVLRVLDQDTAEMLTRKLPEIEVHALRTRSGATDSSVPAIPVDFVSTTLVEVATQRVPLLTPADLISLPKGQAFALLEGGQLWKIRLPLLEARDDPALPPTLATALSEMAKRYTTASGWERA